MPSCSKLTGSVQEPAAETAAAAALFVQESSTDPFDLDGAAGARSHWRFRTRGAESLNQPGMKRMNGRAMRRCERGPGAGFDAEKYMQDMMGSTRMKVFQPLSRSLALSLARSRALSLALCAPPPGAARVLT